jgi:hypothetical protein
MKFSSSYVSINNRQCTYNLTLCHVRVLFASPRLSEEPDTTALEDNNSNTYLGLHVQCPKFFPGCNKVWISSKDFHYSLHYQILLNSVESEPRWYMGRDGQTEEREERGASPPPCANAPTKLSSF